MMKKIAMMLVLVTAASIGFAHNFSVGGDVRQVFVEYGHTVPFGEVLVGVSTVPMVWDVEASLGVRIPLVELDGEYNTSIIAVSTRVHVPFYTPGLFYFGEVGLSGMVDLIVPSNTSDFSLVFSGGARVPVNFQSVGFVARLALKYDF